MIDETSMSSSWLTQRELSMLSDGQETIKEANRESDIIIYNNDEINTREIACRKKQIDRHCLGDSVRELAMRKTIQQVITCWCTSNGSPANFNVMQPGVKQLGSYLTGQIGDIRKIDTYSKNISIAA
jgi:hypothetical protein